VLTDPERWMDQLPPQVSRQADVLRKLLTVARSDSRIRILVVGCSIGRGVADEHSDIDALMAVSVEAWPTFLEAVPDLLERTGALLDRSHKLVTPVEGDPYQLSWALYRDGVELELVVGKAATDIHPAADWVVLHDPDRRIGDRRPIRLATEEQVREWAYEGWSTLLLCAKYLARGSLWEALETLHAARTRAWRLWAAARRVPDPQYGLTAVLDDPDPALPPGMETTHAPLDRAALTRAALACADLLNDLWPRATAAITGQEAVLPPAASAAREKLEAVLTKLDRDARGSSRP
jgi:predicted nucleotidyltransferase